MSYAENLWLFFVLVAGIILVPGMDMLFVLTNALTGGRRAGLAATGGIMLGGVVHTAVGATAVGVILATAPALFTVVLAAGTVYMSWIGLSLIRSSIAVDAVGASATRPVATVFRQGLATCLLNPKAYLFVFAVFPRFIRPEYGPVWSQGAALALLTVATQFAVYGGLAITAAQGRAFLLASRRATTLTGRAAGVLLILAAGLTAWQGAASG